ncbi:unnamed protein product, partial [Vitis vinifera]
MLKRWLCKTTTSLLTFPLISFLGPVPEFKNSVAVDMTPDGNSFCLPKPGECDPRVNILLSIVKSFGYPTKFAKNWKGNDPCTEWFGITCNNGNITVVNFQKMGLTGTISSNFSSLISLQKLVLADNNITGSIPKELTTLPALTQLDVSNNQLYGKIPSFKGNVLVNANGNPDIGKEKEILKFNWNYCIFCNRGCICDFLDRFVGFLSLQKKTKAIYQSTEPKCNGYSSSPFWL